MTQVLLGATAGTPVVIGTLPISTSNLAASLAQAQTDITALATAITAAGVTTATSVTDATAADNAVATVVTDAADADTKVGTVQGDCTTTNTDYDTAAALIVTVFNGGSGTYAYNTSTKQFSGAAPGGGVTVSQANFTSITAALNTMATALLAIQTAAGTAKTATTLVKTDVATAKAATATEKTAATTANTTVAALSTSTIAADVTAVQALSPGPNGAQFLIDSTAFATCTALSGAFKAAIDFARTNAILPP